MRQRATCALPARFPRLGTFVEILAASTCRGWLLRSCPIHARLCANLGCPKWRVPNCCACNRCKRIARSAWWQLGRCDYWSRLGCARNVRRCTACPRTMEQRCRYVSSAMGCDGQRIRQQSAATAAQLVHVFLPTWPQRFCCWCKQPCVHRHAVATMVARFRFTCRC